MFGICHACMEWGRGLEGYQSGYQATGQSSLDLKQPQPAVGTLELPWMMDLGREITDVLLQFMLRLC